MRCLGFTLALLVLFVGPAQAKLLDQQSDQAIGSYPFANASGDLERPKSFRIVLTASPVVPLNFVSDVYISCDKGDRSRNVTIDLEGQPTPYSAPVALPMTRPDWCYVSATAAIDQDPGTTTAQVFGSKRPRR